MKTTVVNIRLDAHDQYIGRSGRGEDGYFGNPFTLDSYDEPTLEARRRVCLDDFRAYFLARVESDPEFRRRVLALRGLRLGCFCAPRGGLPAEADPAKARCHGQIMAAYCDGQPEEAPPC